MDTNQLIERLAKTPRQRTASMSALWGGALGLAIAIAAAVFFATMGPRPDIAAALQTPRFLFKFVVTVALAASAFPLALALSRPGDAERGLIRYLAAAPLLIAAAIVFELVVLPPDTWSARLVGTNSMVCLTLIPLIGIGPLAVFLLVLRHGAPVRPVLAGAVAGLLAGGVAATFYAALCTDDSPLFVATWYSIAIAGLALAGAAAAARFARW